MDVLLKFEKIVTPAAADLAWDTGDGEDFKEAMAVACEAATAEEDSVGAELTAAASLVAATLVATAEEVAAVLQVLDMAVVPLLRNQRLPTLSPILQPLAAREAKPSTSEM